MTIEELKRRIAEENLDGYITIDFNNPPHGCENSEFLMKEPDGACTHIVMGDRGSYFVERRGLAEEEICEQIYKSILAKKDLVERKKQKKNNT